jgi:hypothetical protein
MILLMADDVSTLPNMILEVDTDHTMNGVKILLNLLLASNYITFITMPG